MREADERQRHTGGARDDALRVVATLEETVDTTNRELEAGLRRAGLRLARGLGGGLAGLGLARTLARHCCLWCRSGWVKSLGARVEEACKDEGGLRACSCSSLY